MLNIELGLSYPYDCGYLSAQQARSLVVMDNVQITPLSYAQLLASGFRRSGNMVYRPWCDHCNHCLPIRIPVDVFKPNRSQRRVLKANADLHIEWCKDELTEEQFALYQRYQQGRHADGDMARASFEQTAAFLSSDCNEVGFLEFRLHQQLLAVAVTDRLPDSLSAVYTFFEPELNRRSLGVYALLSQLRLAAEANKRWLYLGYWIPDSRKMAYKGHYLPMEIQLPNEQLAPNRWQRIENALERDAWLRKFSFK